MAEDTVIQVEGRLTGTNRLLADLARLTRDRDIEIKVKADTSSARVEIARLQSSFNGLRMPKLLDFGAQGIRPMTLAMAAAVPVAAAFATSATQAGTSAAALGSASLGAATGVGALAGALAGPLETLKATIQAQKSAVTGLKGADNAAQRWADHLRNQLTPEGKRFTDQLLGMSNRVDVFKRSMERAILPGFSAFLKDIGNSNLDERLEVSAEGIGRSISRATTELGRFMASPFFGDQIQTMIDNNQQAIDNLLDTAVTLVRPITEIFSASSRLLVPFTSEIERLAVKFSDFIDEAERSGSLARWFEDAGNEFEKWYQIGSNVLDVMKSIFTAGLPSGQGFAESFKNLTADIAEWASSDEGQRKIQGFFEYFQKIDWPYIGRALVQFGDDISHVADVLAALGGMIRNAVSPEDLVHLTELLLIFKGLSDFGLTGTGGGKLLGVGLGKNLLGGLEGGVVGGIGGVLSRLAASSVVAVGGFAIGAAIGTAIDAGIRSIHKDDNGNPEGISDYFSRLIDRMQGDETQRNGLSVADNARNGVFQQQQDLLQKFKPFTAPGGTLNPAAKQLIKDLNEATSKQDADLIEYYSKQAIDKFNDTVKKSGLASVPGDIARFVGQPGNFGPLADTSDSLGLDALEKQRIEENYRLVQQDLKNKYDAAILQRNNAKEELTRAQNDFDTANKKLRDSFSKMLRGDESLTGSKGLVGAIRAAANPQAVYSAVSGLVNAVQSAASEGVISEARENSLLDRIRTFNKKVVPLAQEREQLAKDLEKANKNLEDIRSKSTTAQSQIVEFGSVFAGRSPILPKAPDTARQVLVNVGNRLTILKRYLADLATMRRQGWSGEILKQVIEAGPEAGAAMAGELIKADASTRGQINELTNQISATSKQYYTTAFDLLGGPTAQGIVDSLKAKDKAVSNQMASLAKNMVSAFSRVISKVDFASPMAKALNDATAVYNKWVGLVNAAARAMHAETAPVGVIPNIPAGTTQTPAGTVLPTGYGSGEWSMGGTGMATGGWVSGPGTGTSDSVLRRVSNGEFVVNASSAYRHRELLEAINTPGYAKGGHIMIDGEPMSRVAAAQYRIAQKHGGAGLHISQGSYQPHTWYSGSSHAGGGVMDTSPGNFDMQALLRKVGFAAWGRNFPGAHAVGQGAHVHSVSLWDPESKNNNQANAYRSGGDGLGGKDYGPRPGIVAAWKKEIEDLLGSGVSLSGEAGGSTGNVPSLVSMLRGVDLRALNPLASAGLAYLSQLSASGGSSVSLPDVGGTGIAPAGGNPSANEQLGRQLAADRGWAQYANALDQLWTHESGWRNTAQNPHSTAYGIPQFLDATWRTYGPGGRRTSDAREQILAGFEYISDRYKNPGGAWDFWQKHHWYKKGTPFVPEDQPAFLHRGEAVIPAANNPANPANGGSSSNALSQYDIDRLTAALAQVGLKLHVDGREVAAVVDRNQVAYGPYS